MTKSKPSNPHVEHTAYLFALINTTPPKGVNGMVVEKFVLSREPVLVADFPHLHYVLVHIAKGKNYPEAIINLRNHAEKFSDVSSYWRRVYKDIMQQPLMTRMNKPVAVKKAAKKPTKR